jgi:ABC-type cobalamin/Fe3+-siderophores transport system ATPase subunit
MMKQGHILFSGDMETTLTAPRLSTLYGTPMETVQSHGRLLVTRV